MRVTNILTVAMASTAFAYVHDASEDKVQARAITDEVCVLPNAESRQVISDIARIEQFSCSSSDLLWCRCKNCSLQYCCFPAPSRSHGRIWPINAPLMIWNITVIRSAESLSRAPSSKCAVNGGPHLYSKQLP
ncbi:hypothetical protein HBH92_183010 [Parastagonospora nodorum]|nr:hypothetical protein HBI95_160760 [Parastagonospora nodorum]KAH4405380.1 hypothetical protein HBH92_183010 [Parastagonospora nodorum]KAH4532474.1 hypothetical protein HBH85_180060 [Parastagonospora nodorum]KAH4869234.1 hypothetical protein HBH58_158090 [Parastagonospora nodorum]KAH5364107.1 hypothetical protein HBI33_188050 [Parastagonospora nodorum]